MTKTDVLVVGNGIAGLSCVEEIRKGDKEMDITLVGREAYPTYYRVKLTKALEEKPELDKILVKKEEWYRENKVNLILNEIVESIDVENSSVKLDNGKEIGYKKLVLAMGSRAFVPPVAGKFRRGVFALRDYDDIGIIKNYIEDLEEVAVIGGGLLGLEAAWSLKELGKKVHIIEMAENILPRQLNLEMSKKLEEDLLAQGFELHLGVGTKEILGDEVAMTGIELDNGKVLDVKSVLFSVGVRSYLDLVIDTEIESNRGILVDKKLRTNIENIYAAGDVIEFEGVSMGLWTSSMEQGKIVGKNILGEDEEYFMKSPFTSLKLGSAIDIFSIGENSKIDRVYEEDFEDGSERIFVREGKVVGGILYGKTKGMMSLKKAVETRMSIEDYRGNK